MINPPHVIACRLIALPCLWIGHFGEWLWDVFPRVHIYD